LPFTDPAALASVEQDRINHLTTAILLLKAEIHSFSSHTSMQQRALQNTLTEACLQRAHFARDAQHLKLSKTNIMAMDAEAYKQSLKAAAVAEAAAKETMSQNLNPLKNIVNQVHYLRLAAKYAPIAKERLQSLQRAHNISQEISDSIPEVDQEKRRIADVLILKRDIELAEQRVTEEASSTNWLSLIMSLEGTV